MEKAEKAEKERKEQLKDKENKTQNNINPLIAQRISAESASLTSTAFSSRDLLNDRDAYQIDKITKKKGYVSLVTNVGTLNLQLHCDLVPKATENFLLLCEQGYYNGIIFHRLIPNFMIQGGDPTGTGHGGHSAWNKPFKDEFKKSLRHDSIGVVSMANYGPDTNGSQLYFHLFFYYF